MPPFLSLRAVLILGSFLCLVVDQFERFDESGIVVLARAGDGLSLVDDAPLLLLVAPGRFVILLRALLSLLGSLEACCGGRAGGSLWATRAFRVAVGQLDAAGRSDCEPGLLAAFPHRNPLLRRARVSE